jgi:hypothetical protein
MKLTYADALLHLPVDATLRTYLNQQGMVLPPDFDWTDEPATSSRLIAEIQAYPDSGVRDKVVAGLHVSTQLAHPRGKQAMFQATTANSPALISLIGCQSDIHRAFWLFVHHLDLFEQAAEMEYVDSHTQHAQQHDLGIKAPVRRDPASMAAFGDAIKGFYQKELGCGEACVSHLLDRAQGTQLVTVHAKDLAMMRLEFDGTTLQRRVGSPNIQMTLEYSQATGVVRTLIMGGAKYHEMLTQAFASHLLGVEVTAQRIKPPTLDLSTLKLGFQVPQAAADGFVTLQVKSITMMSPDTKLKAEFTAMASSEHECVTELIAEKFAQNNPLAHQWLVSAASINLYYAPPPGKQRSPVVTVEVTRRGRLNLHKFDEKLRAQLEGYLVQIGILQEKQTLSAQVDEAGERAYLMYERAIEHGQ